jgi:hypothetical protein
MFPVAGVHLEGELTAEARRAPPLGLCGKSFLSNALNDRNIWNDLNPFNAVIFTAR